jgi:hypothetical protein
MAATLNRMSRTTTYACIAISLRHVTAHASQIANYKSWDKAMPFANFGYQQLLPNLEIHLDQEIKPQCDKITTI